jgi:hypothetical protein
MRAGRAFAPGLRLLEGEQQVEARFDLARILGMTGFVLSMLTVLAVLSM